MKSRIKLILIFTATLIAFTACASRPVNSFAVDKDQEILKVVLRKFKEKNTFTMAAPKTSLSPAGSSSPPPSSIGAIGKNLQKSMKGDYKVAGLVKYFFSKNRKTAAAGNPGDRKPQRKELHQSIDSGS